MAESTIIVYSIKDPVELNLSYMPFITTGGLFIPSFEKFSLGDEVTIQLELPGRKDILKIDGKVVWITPTNALHHVLSGIGVQFTGANSGAIKTQLENQLDKTMEIGGYTYGMTDDGRAKK